VKAMRESCRIAADALRYAGQILKPGMTSDDVDKAVHSFIVARDAYPSPLGYAGFPKAICTSINEVACHGIPDRS
jgi:methionyl aminopeptidase